MFNDPKTDLTWREQKKKKKISKNPKHQTYKILNLCADPVLHFIMRLYCFIFSTSFSSLYGSSEL